MPNWNVTDKTIIFFKKILAQHRNVAEFDVTHEILFHVRRVTGVELHIVLVNQYVLGQADVINLLGEYPTANIICLASAWNKYTFEAKQYAIQREVGVFTLKEINGALQKPRKYWNYVRKDED